LPLFAEGKDILAKKEKNKKKFSLKEYRKELLRENKRNQYYALFLS